STVSPPAARRMYLLSLFLSALRPTERIARFVICGFRKLLLSTQRGGVHRSSARSTPSAPYLSGANSFSTASTTVPLMFVSHYLISFSAFALSCPTSTTMLLRLPL